MSDTLTLYRGDYEKIRDFDFHKTSKHCLVGPGVYLTTSIKVAESYRVKGADSRTPYFPTVLFDGSAKDRLDAFEKGFDKFFQAWRSQTDQEVPYTVKKDKREAMLKRLEPEARRVYRSMIEEGRIVAQYGTTFRYQAKADRLLRVTAAWDVSVGYLTEFSFPRQEFESSVIRLMEQIHDPQFWELMFDAKISIGTPYEERHEYVMRNIHERSRQLDLVKGQIPAIRRVITPYGYRGIEYQGGVYVGGYGNHRAFCIWDDDYVNQHKVRRFR